MVETGWKHLIILICTHGQVWLQGRLQEKCQNDYFIHLCILHSACCNNTYLQLVVTYK